jgi:hypothetical protein
VGQVSLSTSVREYNLFPVHFFAVILNPNFLLLEPFLRTDFVSGALMLFWYMVEIFMPAIIAQ